MTKPGDLVGGLVDPGKMPGIGGDRTTAEVVHDIVAADPAKHGITVEERKRRALAEAKRIEDEMRAFWDSQVVEESAEITPEQWASLKKKKEDDGQA